MTKKDFQKEKERILKLFEIPIDTDESIQDNITRAKNNFFFFCKTYLSHYLENKTAAFQKKIINLIDSEHKYIAVAAPRGFAKSTLVSFAYVIWSIICEKYNFVVIVSATDDLAEDLSRFIRLEFSDNPLILRDFGKMLSRKGSDCDFVAGSTRVLARGRMQANRGFRYREHRPDLIILDDIEKDEEASNPVSAEKIISFINRSIIPSLDPKGKIIAVGTILRRKSAFGQIILQDNFWEKLIFQALIVNNLGKEQSLWPSRFSTKFLQNQRKIIGLSAFNSEYQNHPHDEQNTFFTESMIKEGTLPPCNSVMFIDPSIDGIKDRDFKACVLVRGSIEKIEVVETVMVQGSDKLFFEKIYELFIKHQEFISVIGFESNGFQKYFGRELEQFGINMGVKFPIKPVQNYIKKEYRIQKLLRFFETDSIVFNPLLMGSRSGQILKEQLCYFPSSKVHDDGPDALAGAVEILVNMHNYLKESQSSIVHLPLYKKRKFIP
ncbi:MAG: hypothetical protein ACRCTQ_05160 [Brevinemataceae bacterium]